MSPQSDTDRIEYVLPFALEDVLDADDVGRDLLRVAVSGELRAGLDESPPEPLERPGLLDLLRNLTFPFGGRDKEDIPTVLALNRVEHLRRGEHGA